MLKPEDLTFTAKPGLARSGTKGFLKLDFEVSAARTILRRSEQRPPLRIIRPFELADGACLLHLHNVSGGILANDLLELKINVGQQAAVQLTTTGATRIYKNRGQSARQLTEVFVAEDGLLEYVPDQLIPFAESSYIQKTRISLQPGAGLFWWEVVAPGREGMGELFQYQQLELDFAIATGDIPLAIERARLVPAHKTLGSLARLGKYRYFASFYICRIGLPVATWLKLEAELWEQAEALSQPGETVWGVSTLTAHGLVVRALSTTHRAVASGLPIFWQLAKLALYQKSAILPRKIY